MDYKSAFYPENRFGGFTDIDCTTHFYTRIHSLISPSSVLLDLGCGRGAYQDETVPLIRELRFFKNKVAWVIGLDVDAAGQSNPSLDEFRQLANGNPWPVNDNSVDIVIADFVLEHLSEPAMFFSECYRVLRAGGYLCLRTTNALSYVGIITRLVPNRYHRRVLKLARVERKEADDFPTAHRCNTVFRIRKMMLRNGFANACYGYDSDPNYLSFSKLAYALGVFHQKYAPKCLKVYIFAFGRKSI